jgi:iron-sulfur cluster repair protein YtfE (RIC family)
MLTQIGRKRLRPPALVDLLLACHQRIRAFLALAQAAARREHTPDAEVVEACAAVERYFRVALPLHVLDEEHSVLPRLRGQAQEIDAALAAMQREHGEHGPKLSALLAACGALRDQPRDARRKARLDAAAGELVRDFEPHLALEEGLLFPALARLPESVQATIIAELRARRGG